MILGGVTLSRSAMFSLPRAAAALCRRAMALPRLTPACDRPGFT